jgi:hypothetical protein
MTNNKMPVVGKRYRRLHCGNEYEFMSYCEARNSVFLKAITGIDKDAIFEFPHQFADKYFEEIPESTKVNTNLQESTQSEISEKDNGSCFNKEGENEVSEVDDKASFFSYKQETPNFLWSYQESPFASQNGQSELPHPRNKQEDKKSAFIKAMEEEICKYEDHDLADLRQFLDEEVAMDHKFKIAFNALIATVEDLQRDVKELKSKVR